jgi:superfamily II DNA or RNA helicase
MTPRSYQQDFIAGVAKGFNEGFRRQLGVMPTAAGKTIVFSHVAARFWTKRKERTLILAHREELVQQAADKLHAATGLVASVEKAERHADRNAPVVIASVQTLQRGRLESWPKDHFGLVIVDEAHHVLAQSFLNSVNHFDARVLGVTATPDRGDRKNLAAFFDNLAYEIGILELVSQKYLSPLRIRSVPLKIDLNSVKLTQGDYDANGLDAAITPYLGAIAREIAAQCGDRKKIVAFLPLITTSEKFVVECRAAGIDARHVDGGSKDRAEILGDFSAGKFRLLSNVSILTEGWDEPGVDCVLVLRPTRSRSLFAQMIGRGMRLAPDKDNCLFLDFLWLHERHDLAKPASLVAKNKEEEAMISTALEKGEKDLGEAVEDAAAEREAALIRAIAENARKRERFITLEQVGAILKDRKIQEYEPTFGWECAPVTEGQRKVLDRFGLSCKTKGEASIIMNRLFDRSLARLATPKQLQWLVRYGYPSPELATAAEAKKFLDEKWKKPNQT